MQQAGLGIVACKANRQWRRGEVGDVCSDLGMVVTGGLNPRPGRPCRIRFRMAR